MKIRYLRWMLLAVTTSGVIVFINHAGQAKMKQDTSPVKSRQLLVKQEGGYSGHEVIGVQEESLPVHPDLLRFCDLAEWKDPDKKTCPENIWKKSGTDATVIGFMYPLEPGSKIKSFCLLRSTQTCCYGPRPQFNQYLLVEMKEPVHFERLKPIMVKGIFIVDPKIEEGYVYRMEGKQVLTPGQKEFEAFMQGSSTPPFVQEENTNK